MIRITIEYPVDMYFFEKELRLSKIEAFVQNPFNTYDEKGEAKPVEGFIECDEKHSEEVQRAYETSVINSVRYERNQLLKETDYIMVSDYPLADKSAWINYRQALRDLPQTILNTGEVNFPEMPTK
jgi:hypothetical protein